MTGLVLLALHIATILADRYAGVGTAGALLPLASGYRPVAVELRRAGDVPAGRGGADRPAAQPVRPLRHRAAPLADIHLAGYLAWASAAWHFYTVGTDATQWWARLVLLAGIGAVAFGLLGRLAGAAGAPPAAGQPRARWPDPSRPTRAAGRASAPSRHRDR